MMNSGSFLVMQILIVAERASRFLINKVCVSNARQPVARTIGTYVYSDNPYMVRQATLRLFLESYFDVVFCAFLNMLAFSEATSAMDFLEYFGTLDDVMNSSVAIVCFILVLIFPFWVYRRIKANFG